MGKCPEKLLARLALSPWPPLFGPFRIILLRHSLICAKFVLSCFSHVPLFATPWTVARQAPLSTEISRGKNTGVSCHSLLQGIFPTQESNPFLLPVVVGGFFTPGTTWKAH